MWRPKQKAPCEASGTVTPQLRLSREEKGKMLVRFGSFAEAISREARLATLPSPNLGAVTLCVNLVLPSEVSDGMANSAPVSQSASEVLSTKAGPAALSSAKHLRNKAANKAPQCASLSKSLSVKSALRSEAKGSSLGADSSAYVASAPKGTTKVLSREVRTKALSNANHFCGDEKNRTSSYAQPNRASALDRLGPAKSDLRRFLTSKRKSES